MLKRSTLLLALLAAACGASDGKDDASSWPPDWLTSFAGYEYTVQLWADFGDGQGYHELTDAEFAAHGESRTQSVEIVRYDSPASMPDKTLFGVLHRELRFVLWMERTEVSEGNLGVMAQVGETPKDTYDETRSPAENDAAGNIDYFMVDGELAPRVMFKDRASAGETWTDYWGPFDPDATGATTRRRDYEVALIEVTFGGQTYADQVKVSTVGPPETGEGTVIEAFSYLDGIGGYQRYFEQQDAQGNVVFKHIATLGPKL